MGLLKKTGIIFIGLLLSLMTEAQETIPGETRELWLPISRTYKEKDTVLAFLSGVKNIGLQNRLMVKAYQSAVDAIPGLSPAKEFRKLVPDIFIWMRRIR
jgi:hypothetical protein